MNIVSDNLFSRLFSYRQREKTSPIENFLSELLAYCIETDSKFYKDLCKQCLKIQDNKFISISTQSNYEEFGRPDIEIVTDKHDILIENKIDASEGAEQLNRYASILTHKKAAGRQKIVVYLTKHYQTKSLINKDIQLICIRWYEIHTIISAGNTEVTRCLKNFLENLNMDKNFNFTVNELNSLTKIHTTFEKMDELLERVKSKVKDNFDGYSNSASRSSSLSDNVYQNYVDLKYKKLQYRLNIGFTWFESEPSVWVGLEFNSKKFQMESDFISVLDVELKTNHKWVSEEYGSYWYYYKSKPIKEFEIGEKDQILSMEKYLTEHLGTLIKLKLKHKKLGLFKK